MKLFTVILSAALVMGSALYAQITSDMVNVRLPAPVLVNGVTIPAGEASIQIVHNNATLMLTVRSESGEHSTVLVNRSESNEDVRDASVVLAQKDGIYKLNRLILPDHTCLQVLDAQ